MQLAEIVATSRQVAEAKRPAGQDRPSRRLPRALRYRTRRRSRWACLAGAPRQRRSGIGYALAARRPSRRSSRRTFADPCGRRHGARRALQLDQRSGLRERALASFRRAVRARDRRPSSDFLTRLLLGELRQGALEVADGRRRRAGGCAAPVVGPAGGDGRARGHAVAVAVLTKASGLRRLPSAVPAHCSRCSRTGGRCRGRARRRSAGGLRVESSTARASRSQGRRRSAVYTRNLNEVTAAVPEVVEAVRTFPARELILDGEVIALRATAAASVPDHDAPFRPHARRGAAGRAAAHRRSSSTACCLGGETLIDAPATERVAGARRRAVPERCCPAARHGRAGRRGALLNEPSAADTKASWRSRRRALRGGQARRRLAQDQEGAHARPGGAGGGVGQRPAQGLADQPSPRRARADNGGFVMLGKTFKGMTDEMLPGRPAASRARVAATPTRSTCAPSSWSRSRSTICRRVRTIPAASRYASRG